MTFLSMWLYKRFASHNVQRLACLIFVVGTWVRFLCIWYGFWPVLMGQIVISLSQPIICNAIALFTNRWFPDSELRMASNICGLSIPGGNLIAFLLAGWIFKGIDSADSAEIKQMLSNMLMVQSIWITAISFFYVILLQERPVHPPSLVAMEPKKDINFCQSLYKAIQLPNYRRLVAVFSLLQGSFLAFGTNIDQLFEPIGFSSA